MWVFYGGVPQTAPPPLLNPPLIQMLLCLCQYFKKILDHWFRVTSRMRTLFVGNVNNRWFIQVLQVFTSLPVLYVYRVKQAYFHKWNMMYYWWICLIHAYVFVCIFYVHDKQFKLSLIQKPPLPPIWKLRNFKFCKFYCYWLPRTQHRYMWLHDLNTMEGLNFVGVPIFVEGPIKIPEPM